MIIRRPLNDWEKLVIVFQTAVSHLHIGFFSSLLQTTNTQSHSKCTATVLYHQSALACIISINPVGSNYITSNPRWEGGIYLMILRIRMYCDDNTQRIVGWYKIFLVFSDALLSITAKIETILTYYKMIKVKMHFFLIKILFWRQIDSVFYIQLLFVYKNTAVQWFNN